MPSNASFQQRHGLLFATAMIVMMCVGQTFFFGTPAYVGMMAEQWRLPESQLGQLVTAEILGNSAGALALAFLMTGLPVRRVVAVSLLALVLSNALMSTHPSFGLCLLLRTLSGAACGALSGVAMRYLSAGAGAEKRLGAAVMAQNVHSMLLLSFVLPGLVTLQNGLLLISGAGVLCAVVLGCFSRSEALVPEHSAGPAPVKGGIYLSLGSLFMLYGGVGVAWTFVERIGVSTGLNAEQVGQLLGASTMLSLLGCVVAPLLIAKGHRYSGALISLLICAASAAMMALPMTPQSFSVAAFLFQLGWSASAIMMFATLPLYDGIGRHVAAGPGVLGLGYGAGSMLGGELMESVSPQAAYGVGALWFLAATLLYALLLRVRTNAAAPH